MAIHCGDENGYLYQPENPSLSFVSNNSYLEDLLSCPRNVYGFAPQSHLKYLPCFKKFLDRFPFPVLIDKVDKDFQLILQIYLGSQKAWKPSMMCMYKLMFPVVKQTFDDAKRIVHDIISNGNWNLYRNQFGIIFLLYALFHYYR